MPTITVINPKGGSGKTTTLLMLGLELARRGARVIFLDCDNSNQAISYWAESAEENGLDLPDGVTVITNDEIEAKAKEANNYIDAVIASYATDPNTYVLVDLAGEADQWISDAAIVSHLVLTPLAPKTLDKNGFIKAVAAVARGNRHARHNVLHLGVFTKIPSFGTSNRTREKRRKIIAKMERFKEEQGVEFAKTRFHEREGYDVFDEGIDVIEWDDVGVGNKDAIMEECGSFCDEVLVLLRNEYERKAGEVA